MYLHCNKKADSEPDRATVGRYFYVSKDLQRCLSCNAFPMSKKKNRKGRYMMHMAVTQEEFDLILQLRCSADMYAAMLRRHAGLSLALSPSVTPGDDRHTNDHFYLTCLADLVETMHPLGDIGDGIPERA